jgi:hypothetical protein
MNAKLVLAVLAGAALSGSVLAQGAASPSNDAAKPGAANAATSSSAAGAPQAERRLRVDKGQTGEQLFKKLDTNGDGMISKQEAAAKDDLPDLFAGFDRNDDQQLSSSEFMMIPLLQENSAQGR